MGQAITYETNAIKIPYKARTITLKRAFDNLIYNAIKYGHKAHVCLNKTAKQIIITVEDDGPGIPEEELAHVFNPFYRCDRSRSRKIAGTGLGLTIAKDAIRAHGGTIALHNKETGGLCATIRLVG